MTTPLEPAAKKAYEVGYALFRVAAILPSRPFARLLEREALDLLRSAINGAPADSAKSIAALSYFISFGKDTGIIHPENGDLLIRQLEELQSMLGSATNDLAKEEIPVGADIADIFKTSRQRPLPLSDIQPSYNTEKVNPA